jgi:Glycosyltransferase family 87
MRRRRTLKVVVAACVTGALVYLLFAHAGLIRRNLAVRDSIAYWAAARPLIHHQDPYNHTAVLELERQQGYQQDRPLVLRTPPWSLFMVLPMAFLTPLWAWALWLAVLLFCLAIGLRLCRRLYGSEDLPQNAFTVVAYTFAPVLGCLVSGQMGLVLMLGVILFLWWEAERPFLAGAALILPFAKPHLLSLFWLALVLWIVLRRKTRVAFGFATAFAVATLLALVLDPQVFTHYREMLQQAAIGKEFIPALSGVVRLLFFRRFFWVQFIPMAIGTAWSLWYLQRNWSVWDWRQHGPALLVVAVLTTPYEWLSDETVLLPAILQALAFVYAVRNSLKASNKIVLIIFAMLNALLLLILRFKIPFSTGIYFWSSLVWFSWYFYARRLRRRTSSAKLAEPLPEQSIS